jgi:CheY-like chemotaxis protein
MSQKDLADSLYVDQSTVSRWERGIRFPDTELIEKMATRFGVDASVLFDAPMNRSELPQIIVVEDEPVLLQDFCSTVRATLPDSSVLPFRWASEALAFVKTQRVDVAFLDIELVGGNGVDLARGLLRCQPRCNVVFLTSHPEYAREALDLFCSGYVLKPISPAKIREQAAHLRYPVPGLGVSANE